MEDKNLGHLMLDLETFGSDSDSVICSIGAVEFDIKTGETGRQFYQKIDVQSCLDMGLKVSGATLMWWLRQSEDARRELYDAKPEHVGVVLQNFRVFFNALGKDTEIWGNSNRFDMGILENAYKKNFVKIPWDFRKERDVRTLVSFRPEIQKETVFEGTAHNPIADCMFQITYCTKIWNVINNPVKMTFKIPITKTTTDEDKASVSALIKHCKESIEFDETVGSIYIDGDKDLPSSKEYIIPVKK